MSNGFELKILKYDHIYDLFQTVRNILMGKNGTSTTEQKKILEIKNTEIKKYIDKCIELKTQYDPQKYSEFETKILNFIKIDAIVMGGRFQHFHAGEQLLENLELDFNYTMKKKEESGNYTEKDEEDVKKFFKLKTVYSGLLNDLMETYGITVSLLSQIKDCYLTLSSLYKKENSEIIRSFDDPLYKNLVDLENDAMVNPISENEVIQELASVASRKTLGKIVDPNENEVIQELAFSSRKSPGPGGSRRYKNKKSRKSKNKRKTLKKRTSVQNRNSVKKRKPIKNRKSVKNHN